MEFNIIDSKAIAREQNALKRKYDKFLEQANELPMRKENREDLEMVLSEAFKNKIRDIVDAAMNSEIADAEFEEETGSGTITVPGATMPVVATYADEPTDDPTDDPDDLKDINI